MKKRGLHLAQAAYLESLQKYFEAGEVYLLSAKDEVSQLQKVRSLFEHSTDCDPGDARRLARGVLDRLWTHRGYQLFGNPPSERDRIADKLFDVATELVRRAESPTHTAEVCSWISA